MPESDITPKRIRDARERAGLTQEELGTLVGRGLRTVGSWERGQHLPRRWPTKLRDFVERWDNTVPPTTGVEDEPTLHGCSDHQLVSEIMYRLGRARGHAN